MRNRTLTVRQAAFAREYLIDLNATQAAIRAGYSVRTAYSQGQRLLKNVEMAAAINSAMTDRAARTEITQDRVLQELARIAFANLCDAVTWNSEQIVRLVNSEELGDDTAAAIAEVAKTREGMRIRMHDKVGALIQIGRHLGMFEKDKSPIDVHVSLEQMVLQAIKRESRTASLIEGTLVAIEDGGGSPTP